jgi:hypothetical protein
MNTQSSLKIIAESSANKISSIVNTAFFFKEPFTHLYIDNFFPEEFAQSCLASFPELDNPCWEHSNDPGIEIKSRSTWNSEFDIPEGIVDAVRVLNSSICLKAIGESLGIQKLMPDPYFSGGGLNCTQSGGLLDVHVDGNYHDASGMNRRVNAILYLNKNWKDGFGGEFGVYDNLGESVVRKIAPLYNRLVIFDTHDKSYHGLPDPVCFPEGDNRKSIILYYYTVAPRPNAQVSVSEPHSALWKSKSFTDKRGNKIRDFS